MYSCIVLLGRDIGGHFERNAVPTVKKLLERTETAFPLLKCRRTRENDAVKQQRKTFSTAAASTYNLLEWENFSCILLKLNSAQWPSLIRPITRLWHFCGKAVKERLRLIKVTSEINLQRKNESTYSSLHVWQQYSPWGVLGGWGGLLKNVDDWAN